ncbi:MAG: DUF2306 domain-containing protein [Acidobacteriota bacterium]|nr:DUF2306 domain-containing protein [Acidobacteriota bacterium]
MWPFLLVHVCAAVVGLLSGFLSIALRKGSGLHRAAGSIFFGSMLIMSSSAAYIAEFLSPNKLNVVVALLTFYLVVTAWWAARRKDGPTGTFDLVALLYVLAVGVAGVTFGLEAVNSPKGTKDGMPAVIYFIFGGIALLCAVTDIRMFARGGIFGSHRIARHLWRMCLALLIATFSFYPGQARQLPEWLRQSGVLWAPHILLIGSMIYYRLRYRTRKRAKPDKVVGANYGQAIVERLG